MGPELTGACVDPMTELEAVGRSHGVAGISSRSSVTLSLQEVSRDEMSHPC